MYLRLADIAKSRQRKRKNQSLAATFFLSPKPSPKGRSTKKMIRLFTGLCKAMLGISTDKDLFLEATEGVSLYDQSCPHCGALGKLISYADYLRWLVQLKDGHIISQRIQVFRFKCKSCGTTHALLPDIIIPYSQYSLRFKICALIAYFERTSIVVSVCERFGIAVSTLYAWKALLLSHQELLLGLVASRKVPAFAFLCSLFGADNLSEHLRDFFGRHAFSFLQSKAALTTRSPGP
jgi:hypothetical protein